MCYIKYKKKEPINNKNIAILIILHGYGSDEKDLFYLFNKIPDNFLILSLRGFYPVFYGGFSWYEMSFLSKNKILVNKKQIINSIEKITSFIKKIINIYNISNNNIWICGFSQGAILSYYISLNYPNLINKVIILSGFIYDKILINDKKNQNNLKFFISHGKEDNVIPVKFARESLKIIEDLKITNIYYREYEAEHTICNLNYKDLMNWININNT